MKLKQYSNIFFVFSFCLVLFSCKTQPKIEVKNAYYTIYNRGTERGYVAEFQWKKSKEYPVAIVINRVKQDISPEHRIKDGYKVTIVAQSQKIFGKEPTIVDLPNGIFIKKASGEIFQEVDFQLKENNFNQKK